MHENDPEIESLLRCLENGSDIDDGNVMPINGRNTPNDDNDSIECLSPVGEDQSSANRVVAYLPPLFTHEEVEESGVRREVLLQSFQLARTHLEIERMDMFVIFLVRVNDKTSTIFWKNEYVIGQMMLDIVRHYVHLFGDLESERLYPGEPVVILFPGIRCTSNRLRGYSLLLSEKYPVVNNITQFCYLVLSALGAISFAENAYGCSSEGLDVNPMYRSNTFTSGIVQHLSRFMMTVSDWQRAITLEFRKQKNMENAQNGRIY